MTAFSDTALRTRVMQSCVAVLHAARSVDRCAVHTLQFLGPRAYSEYCYITVPPELLYGCTLYSKCNTSYTGDIYSTQ